MSDILAPDNRELVREFAAAKLALVLDFDGTLAPIHRDRRAATMRLQTRALLRRVAARYPTAVLSGRMQEDVAARVAGLPLAHVVGSHGADWGWAPLDGGRLAERMHAWHAALRQRLEGVAGIELEDKRYSLAIHYRYAPDREEAQRLVSAALRELRGLRVTQGKAVVNVLAEGAPDKGVALERLRQLLGCERALYVGDDANDEDAFALHDGRHFLAVRVGAKPGSRAPFFLRGQEQMDRLLALLIRLRPGRPQTPASQPPAPAPTR